MKEAASDAICAERLPGDISQSIKAFVVGPPHPRAQEAGRKHATACWPGIPVLSEHFQQSPAAVSRFFYVCF